MTDTLTIHRAGPGLTLQDMGRPGYLALGLSRGGAADRLALAEGAALLGQSTDLTAIEMTGMGGEFEATRDTRIALTGAPMAAAIDGTRIAWNASHTLPAQARLTIGSASEGVYGYLHVGGGFHPPERLGAHSAHLAAGIGALLEAGDRIDLGPDDRTTTGLMLPKDTRFAGGTIRILPSIHTDAFPQELCTRFEDTAFTRDTRGNRMGVQLKWEGDGFLPEIGRKIVSEVIMPGDIQIIGDGTPYVLLSECQTTGGYPRIATVLPCDLPRIAQAPAGAPLNFSFVTLEDAVEAERKATQAIADLPKRRQPLIRDPATIPNLLAYQLISGMTAGRELDPEGACQ